jgi:hypothetical protein
LVIYDLRLRGVLGVFDWENFCMSDFMELNYNSGKVSIRKGHISCVEESSYNDGGCYVHAITGFIFQVSDSYKIVTALLEK